MKKLFDKELEYAVSVNGTVVGKVVPRMGALVTVACCATSTTALSDIGMRIDSSMQEDSNNVKLKNM